MQKISHIINKIDTDIAPCHKVVAQFNMFCFSKIADDNEGTLYTDGTGNFLISLYNGNQYIFLAYVYNLNTIIVEPMKPRETT